MSRIRTVLTVGSFDIVHSEHVDLLNHCGKLAGWPSILDARVIVGLNSDRFIEEKKGRPPLMNWKQREDLLYGMRNVSFVEAYDGGGILPMMNYWEPQFLTVGSDWAAPGKDYLAEVGLTFEKLAELKCALVYAPSKGKIHSSDLRKRIEEDG